jgi:hypothetical protein
MSQFLSPRASTHRAPNAEADAGGRPVTPPEFDPVPRRFPRWLESLRAPKWSSVSRPLAHVVGAFAGALQGAWPPTQRLGAWPAVSRAGSACIACCRFSGSWSSMASPGTTAGTHSSVAAASFGASSLDGYRLHPKIRLRASEPRPRGRLRSRSSLRRGDHNPQHPRDAARRPTSMSAVPRSRDRIVTSRPAGAPRASIGRLGDNR